MTIEVSGHINKFILIFLRIKQPVRIQLYSFTVFIKNCNLVFYITGDIIDIPHI